jgi:hypothetical protein
MSWSSLGYISTLRELDINVDCLNINVISDLLIISL